MQLVPCDGDVSKERLDLLLRLGAEYRDLDYKSFAYTLSPAGPSRAEFVKDAAAMFNNPKGGYIVLGVDDDGRPCAATHDGAAFDQAKIGPILDKYLGPGPWPTATSTHDVDGHTVTLLYFGRRRDHRFAIVTNQLTYRSTDKEGEREVIALREGDVFVRDNTTTRNWKPADLDDVLEPWIDHVRAEERSRTQTQLQEVVDQLSRAADAQRSARGPLGALNLALPPNAFNEILLETVRAGDDVALSQFFLATRRAIADLMVTPTNGTFNTTPPNSDDGDKSGDGVDFDTIVNRLTSVAMQGVALRHLELVERSADLLQRLYDDMPWIGSGREPTTTATSCLVIAQHVLATMSLAVRLDWWKPFPTLTLRPVGPPVTQRLWIKHATVMTARHGIGPRSANDQPFAAPILLGARELLATHAEFQLDTTVEAIPVNGLVEGDRVLSSLCQADLLGCITAVLGGEPDGHPRQRLFWPSFAELYPSRVANLVRALDSGTPQERDLGAADHDELEQALRAVLRAANSEVPHGHGDWDYDDLITYGGY